MKQRKFNKLIVSVTIIAMLALSWQMTPFQPANAVDQINDAKDTLSDSDLERLATHTIQFTTGTSTPTGGYLQVEFHADFGDVTAPDITCPANFTASAPDVAHARCTADNDRPAGAYTIVVANVQNPAAANSYTLEIINYDGAATRERAQIRVAIISDVAMTARVNASLTFAIAGLANTDVVNGVNCSTTTSATLLNFGTLSTTASTTVCQRLTVQTNADDGFTVTVWEDDELTADSGSNINSFNNSPDGTGTTTPEAWTGPVATLDHYNTYGHMGLTADDETLNWGGGDPFNVGGAEAYYAGFNGTSTVEVMYHDGPADGTTVNKGMANVAYTAEISALQEAGDYQNTLTYICTPQY